MVPIHHLRVKAGARVLLHTKNIEMECSLEFWVSHMSLLEPETSGTDEALVFGRFPGESFADESDLGVCTVR